MPGYTGALLAVCCTIFCLAAGQVDLLHCRNPLGMQDKRIPDDHLTASSFHAIGTGPKYARLTREEGGGAWCPKGLILQDQEDQYLQIQLPSMSFLSVIATQGRDAGGAGQEYTPSYKLNYSRDGVTWKQWQNFRGDTVLTGNKDPRNVQRQLLNPGIPSARHVRLIPVTSRPMVVCARIELYGCIMTSGVFSYEMPRPGAVSKDDTLPIHEDWSLDDEFYDGYKGGESYFGGLGQLTDGVVGSKDLSETKSKIPTREVGFDYVGWQNNKRGDRYVTMTFHFEEVRNFSAIRVHSVSQGSIGAKLFSNIQVSFSLNGRTFLNNPYAPKVAFDVPDVSGDVTRFVDVPLNNAMARYVRARFQIRGEWMLISEVEFESDVVDQDPHPDLMYPEVPTVEVLQLPVTTGTDYNGPVSRTAAKGGFVDGDGNYVGVFTEPTATPTANHTAVIACSLAAVILLLLLIVGLLMWRQRRLRKTMTPPRYTYTSGNSLSGTTRASVTLCIPEQSVTLTPTACPFPEKSSDPLYHEIAGARGVSADYLEPNDVLKPKYRLPEVTQLAQQSMLRDRRFEQPDVTMCASGVRDGVMTIPHYAETEVRAMPPPYATPLQGPFGNNVYAVPWSSSSPSVRPGHVKDQRGTPPRYTATPSEASTLLADDSQDELGFQTLSSIPEYENKAIEFPRESLEFIERLGEGQFGEVRLCEADPSLRKCVQRNGIILSGSPDSPVLVAVKVLRDDATPNAKEDFLKEVKVMSQLRDPNIVQLIAVCTEDEPYAMITEYMEHGDLNQYLKGFDVDETSYPTYSNRRPNAAHSSNQPECSSQLPTIRSEVLLSMAAQIASGMKYLSSLNFVHRDLATRNCLVGANHSIRIADFGMSRNMYQADYYKIQGKAVLPIRWMSWECILLGKFSTASDVWAFGVTMWEIFTLCKCQPYHALEDKEVIENMHHIYQRTGEEVYLPKPKACPTTAFNMVRQCWKRESEDRPTFDQLCAFLKENA